MDIEREITYPLRDERWLKTMLIGGLLNIVPVICFFSWGYSYRVLRRTMQGDDVLPLPPWDRWKENFIRGLMIFLLSVCWAVIPLILVKFNALLGVLTFILAAVFFPMSLVSYAMKEQCADAFRLDTLWKRISARSGMYVKAWLVCAFLFVVALFIYRLPVIGYPVGAFLFFYVLLVYARLFGLVGREAGAGPTLPRQ